jgi:hypothetical protein
VQTYSKYWLVLGLVLFLLLLPGCKASPSPVNNGQEPTEGESPGGNEGVDDPDDNGETGEQQGGENDYNKDIQFIVTGDNLAVRKTPGTKDKGAEDILSRLKKDQAVYLQSTHDNQVDVDGYVWWEIYDPASKVKGWCAAKHLGSVEAPKLGTIEGSITFPSDFIPDGFTVVVEDVATGKEYMTGQVIYDSKYRFGVGFVIKVPPGNYYVYAFEPAIDFKAYYDVFVQSDFEIDSEEKIVVTVGEGQHVDDVFVGNWWREE